MIQIPLRSHHVAWWCWLCLLVLLGYLPGCQRKQPTITPPLVATLAPTLEATPTLNPTAIHEAATLAARPTETATPLPTPTPLPHARLDQAKLWMTQGRYDEVVASMEEALSAETSPDLINQLRQQLALAHIANEDYDKAKTLFLKMNDAQRQATSAYFYLGEAYRYEGDCANAETSYTRYLARHAEIAAYLYARIGQCYAQNGGSVAMQRTAYQSALAHPAHYLVTYQNRLALAQLWMQEGEYAQAAQLYAEIRDSARTQFTRGEMSYLAASAQLLADGDTATAYATYQQLLRDFPAAPTTHKGLIELVNAEEIVDPYWRGLVNYYAQSYQPCVTALEKVLPTSADDYRHAQLLLAYCYEGLGQMDQALALLDHYTELSPTTYPIGLWEKGQMLERLNRLDQAVISYDQLWTLIPQDERAEEAMWRSAELVQGEGDEAEAIRRYQAFAQQYPEADSTPRALFRAGWIAYLDKDEALAKESWAQSAEQYGDSEFGQASLLWWLKLAPQEATALRLAETITPTLTYYGARLQDTLDGIEPFAPTQGIERDNQAVQDQAGAERFLRELTETPASVRIDRLPPLITDDLHFKRGVTLWQLRQFGAAKQEFELLREANSDNVLVSYQLALYFRELGLYRSSILASVSVLNWTERPWLSLPPFLLGLAYPTYYHELVLPLADEYGYDPLLRFSLLRQESLFESFATSSAAALGLAQVIPTTGEYVAQKLGVTGYQSADLYKPHIGLRFGAYYLYEQLNLFDGQVAPALAAYNGGPGNALRWQKVAGGDIDQLVIAINFPESRLYVESIYTHYFVYRHLYAR